VERSDRCAPSHKRVLAVAIESVQAAIFASFLGHLRAGFVEANGASSTLLDDLSAQQLSHLGR
jgi:hypothetical protein